MKKLLPWILVFVFGWMVVAQPSSIFGPRVETQIKTDTVHVDRPYEIEIIREIETKVPYRVTVYETHTDTIVELKVRTDTVFVSTQAGEQILYHPSFLTSFPAAHKLLNANISLSEISVTTLNPRGRTQTSSWMNDLSRSDITIGYDEYGNLAVKKSSIRWYEHFRRSFFQEAGLNYEYFNQTPAVSYRVGFESVYQNLGIQTEIELSSQNKLRMGIFYRW